MRGQDQKTLLHDTTPLDADHIAHGLDTGLAHLVLMGTFAYSLLQLGSRENSKKSLEQPENSDLQAPAVITLWLKTLHFRTSKNSP
jgi:hypothetical protein